MQLNVLNLLEEVVSENIKANSLDFSPKLEIGRQGFKITVGKLPSRITVYNRLVFEDGKVTSRHYQAARNYWYSLMKKALEDYNRGPIDPALICILYYMPKNSDVGNFISKFIIDGLMYFGGIAPDDNVEHVKAISEV